MNNKKIIEEFEKNGMIIALKGAQDFSQDQYDLMLKLFKDIALPLQKQEFKGVVDRKDIQHNEFCEKTGKQFKKCCRCILDEILKAIENL